jgi:hypothetical protein
MGSHSKRIRGNRVLAADPMRVKNVGCTLVGCSDEGGLNRYLGRQSKRVADFRDIEY